MMYKLNDWNKKVFSELGSAKRFLADLQEISSKQIIMSGDMHFYDDLISKNQTLPYRIDVRKTKLVLEINGVLFDMKGTTNTKRLEHLNAMIMRIGVDFFYFIQEMAKHGFQPKLAYGYGRGIDFSKGDQTLSVILLGSKKESIFVAQAKGKQFIFPINKLQSALKWFSKPRDQKPLSEDRAWELRSTIRLFENKNNVLYSF